jgi:transcriptional regulator with XRE-family HTH domain
MSSRHSRVGEFVLALIGLLHIITLGVREVGHQIKELSEELPASVQGMISATSVALGRIDQASLLIGVLLVVVVGLLAMVYRDRFLAGTLGQSITHLNNLTPSAWRDPTDEKTRDRVAGSTNQPVSRYLPNSSISTAIKVLRTIRRMSKSELAAVTGVSKSTISDYESGKVDPQFQTVRNLLQGLDLPVSILDQVQPCIESVWSQVGASGQSEFAPTPANPPGSPGGRLVPQGDDGHRLSSLPGDGVQRPPAGQGVRRDPGDSLKVCR